MNIPFMRFTNRVSTLIGIACMAIASGLAVAAQADATDKAGVAVWQPYELDFHYFGTSTYYNCSSLEDRLEGILRELGADKDVRANVTGCFGSANLGKMLNAHINVRMPALTNDTTADAFPVNSKTVSLKSGRSGDALGSDCELLEQIRDQILPALKLQAVKDDLSCIPGHANYASRSLQVTAWVPDAKPATH